jgi:UDPglucose 6-dehydrogenase
LRWKLKRFSEEDMKVSVVGTGYVGLVSGTCFAEIGHEVTCIDLDVKKVETLKEGKSPIYEPGLTDLLERNISSGRLSFSTNYDSIKKAQTIFLAVGTPSSDTGEANLEYLEKAAVSVAENLSDDGIIVIKSTVPVGTNKLIRKLVGEHTKKKFYIVNNPEFLKEGSAVDDFMRPDRVVIGHDDPFAAKIMEELYAPLVRQGNPIYMMSNQSAEMAKYAANCFLATKISFINEIAKLCDATGADIEEVRKGITSDRRIGHHFLYPGIGYGGSCFPKDVQALMATGRKHEVPLRIVEAAEQVNKEQKTLLFKKLLEYFKGNIKGKTFAFWGVAFKPNTDDIREAPSIDMARAIIEEGGSVRFFDPVAADNFSNAMSDYSANLTKCSDKYECLEGSDALCLITEWGPFRAPNFDEIKSKLNNPVIFDGRNLYQTHMMIEKGIKYFAIGKHIE